MSLCPRSNTSRRLKANTFPNTSPSYPPTQKPLTRALHAQPHLKSRRVSQSWRKNRPRSRRPPSFATSTPKRRSRSWSSASLRRLMLWMIPWGSDWHRRERARPRASRIPCRGRPPHQLNGWRSMSMFIGSVQRLIDCLRVFPWLIDWLIDWLGSEQDFSVFLVWYSPILQVKFAKELENQRPKTPNVYMGHEDLTMRTVSSHEEEVPRTVSGGEGSTGSPGPLALPYPENLRVLSSPEPEYATVRTHSERLGISPKLPRQTEVYVEEVWLFFYF